MPKNSMGGGSLLNDLLSDLDAAITANELIENDPTDDLFASLQRDLPGSNTSNRKAPGLMSSAGAFVVSRQAPAEDVTLSTDARQDAWSAALSSFGGMSLAEDFLAADSAKKQNTTPKSNLNTAPEAADVTSNVLDMVFEDDYALDEEAKLKNQEGGLDGEMDAAGGLMALLGASRAKTQPKEANQELEPKKENNVAMQSPQETGIPPPMMPPPGTMMPPPHPILPMMPPPPGAMMPPPPGAMLPPNIMSIPPPHLMGGPPPPSMLGMPPNYGSKPPGSYVPASQHLTNNQTNSQLFKNRDFPSLGATPQEIEESKAIEPEEVPPTTTSKNLRAHILFNNPDPAAPPINAALVESTLMPPRDICYIVNAMMRPLASLDAYNDDYYHWSYVDRKSRNMLMLGGMMAGPRLPNPVWKEVKVEVKEREIKYRESMEARSKEFAEEKKSLGRLVKSNVNRPKALLVTPALKKENTEDGSTLEEEKVESDYESERKRSRIQSWKARVAIDKGYAAFLTLTELRRLIQANAGATQLIHELTGDVKANVNLMHASFGVVIKNDDKGHRKIEINQPRFESTLSMAKGRVLFARVIEGGILPHQSACELLPVAMGCIFKTALPASEGEDRLLRALMGLVITVQPSVEPGILARCLDVAIAAGKEDKAGSDGKKMPNITGSRVRMELLHAVLSRGKTLCGDDAAFGWVAKEKEFTALLTS